MTEEDARDWINDRYGADALAKCETLITMVSVENRRQNLVSERSLREIWSRHIVDSAQLIELHTIPRTGGWVDVGSGAGFPGLVIAILGDYTVRLVEPRRKRADFMQCVTDALNLRSIMIEAADAKAVRGTADIISARAVASLEAIFEMTAHLAQPDTVWVLPKGRNAISELEAAKRTWQGVFHVERSLTASDAHIVTAMEIRRK